MINVKLYLAIASNLMQKITASISRSAGYNECNKQRFKTLESIIKVMKYSKKFAAKKKKENDADDQIGEQYRDKFTAYMDKKCKQSTQLYDLCTELHKSIIQWTAEYNHNESSQNFSCNAAGKIYDTMQLVNDSAEQLSQQLSQCSFHNNSSFANITSDHSLYECNNKNKDNNYSVNNFMTSQDQMQTPKSTSTSILFSTDWQPNTNFSNKGSTANNIRNREDVTKSESCTNWNNNNPFTPTATGRHNSRAQQLMQQLQKSQKKSKSTSQGEKLWKKQQKRKLSCGDKVVNTKKKQKISQHKSIVILN